MSIKLNRAIDKANIFKGSQTVMAIVDQVPEQLIKNLSSKDLAVVLEAINQAYHNGKASTGAEMIDKNCVWIENIGRSISIEKENGDYKSTVNPTPEEMDSAFDRQLKELQDLSKLVDDGKEIPKASSFELKTFPNLCSIGDYRYVTHQIVNNKGVMAVKNDGRWFYHV